MGTSPDKSWEVATLLDWGHMAPLYMGKRPSRPQPQPHGHSHSLVGWALAPTKAGRSPPLSSCLLMGTAQARKNPLQHRWDAIALHCIKNHPAKAAGTTKHCPRLHRHGHPQTGRGPHAAGRSPRAARRTAEASDALPAEGSPHTPAVPRRGALAAAAARRARSIGRRPRPAGGAGAHGQNGRGGGGAPPAGDAPPPPCSVLGTAPGWLPSSTTPLVLLPRPQRATYGRPGPPGGAKPPRFASPAPTCSWEGAKPPGTLVDGCCGWCCCCCCCCCW